jgi:AcrR family transcriptional regulator
MTRRRGRPPKSADPATRDRLLDAAAQLCIDVGFDAVTVAAVAARAGVTPAAVYNHFTDKAELLYTAGRLAIGRLNATTVAPTGDPVRAAHDVVAAFLDPSFRESRRLVLELHVAGTRHPELARHLADWHREFAGLSTRQGHGGPPAATVKTFFLLLLGLCHLDALEAIVASPSELQGDLDRLVDLLFGSWTPPVVRRPGPR